jgi:hypothetical protein
MNIEQVILNNLVHNEEFTRKSIPFLKSEYFHDRSEKVVFELVDNYFNTYNTLPSPRSLLVDLTSRKDLDESSFPAAQEVINSFEKTNVDSIDWLLENTEQFCKDKAIYNAVRRSIEILDDPNSEEGAGALPGIMSEALSVGFDTNIGHDYMEGFDDRYEYYRRTTSRIPFNLELMNHITKGGLPNKTLNIILAGTNVGKSLIMCDWAANNLADGLDVLYITLEMAEEMISQRIDGNLLDIELDDMPNVSAAVWDKKVEKLKKKVTGRLIVKEFPTAAAHAGNFRHLLNELRIKKNFRPKIIYIDYLNICASSRIKLSGNINSYTYVKSIAEELRGLAVEFDLPIVSATQTTRTGYSSSDLDVDDTSESFGLPATADLMIGVMETEELAELGQYLFKQLKNRYADKNKCKRFVIGVHKAKMRLFDVEQDAQEDILGGPVMDKTETGRRLEEERLQSLGSKGFDNSKFKGFK